MRLRLILLLSSLLLAFPAQAEEGTSFEALANNDAFSTTIMDINLSMGPGRSYYVHELEVPLRSDQIKISYYPSFRCPKDGHGLYGVAIRDRTNKQWHFSKEPGFGFFDLQDLSFDAIRLELQSYKSYTMTCRMVAAIKGASLPDSDLEEYAGVISHQGGFQYRLRVEMEFTYETQFFRIDIPNYCQGLAVDEVGLETSNGFVAAELFDASQSKYRFADPLRLDHLTISLNAPLDKACDLPVYVYRAE